MPLNAIKNRSTIAIFILGLILGATSLALAAGANLEPRPIAKEMGCPTCGMYPVNYPQWHSQVIFDDSSLAAFDGSKCMFRFLLGPNRKAVAAVWVKDFGSGKWIDGKAAHYVMGSRVLGPMGKELIPFADLAAAEAFQKINGGSLAPYAGISMATIHPLMGGMGHGH